MMSLLPLIISQFLIVGFLILVGAYFYFKYRIFNFWSKKGVFYIEPSFPVGNLMPIVTSKTSIGEFFQDIYIQNKKHRYVGLYTFHRPNLLINDPDLIRVVLAKEFSSFHDRGMYCNEKIDPLSGHLFLLPGKKWRNLRVRLTPTFTSGKIKQMFAVLKETGDALSDFLQSKAETKETVEMKDILARFSTDIIMSTAFGITSNSLENPQNEFRHWGKKVFEPKPFWNSFLLFAPQIFDFFSIPYTEKAITNFFMSVFKDTIKYREENSIVRKDFMDLLIQLMKNGYVEADEVKTDISAKSKLTVPEAVAQAYVFFLAGFETSATTTTFCLYELAIHQDIQDKVREEIRNVLKKHDGLSYNAICDMTYFHKVVSETMRKYPAVGFLNRICTEDIDLPTTNIHVPKGLLVTIPVLGLHRDPNLYPDPEKFDPERFNEENIAARHPYAYLPFGEGPRICIGLRFGLMQVKVALISILTKFKVKHAPTTPNPLVYEKGSFITVPEGGLPLKIELA